MTSAPARLADMPDVLRLKDVARVLDYGPSHFTVEHLDRLGIPYFNRSLTKGGVRVSRTALQRWMEGGA